MRKPKKGPVPVITHDRLFRKALGYRDVARSFFKGFLPPEIRVRCNLRALKKVPAATVGKNHRDNFMDLVYTCPFGQNGQTAALCLLLEHKSDQKNDVARQLLRYMLEIWQSQQDSNLPMMRIVPLVVYHGPTDWQHRPIAAEFGPADPLLDCYMPQFEYHCVDLHAMPEVDIERLAKGVLALVFKAMKHARQPEALEKDLEQATLLLGLPSTSDRNRNLLDALIVYILDRLNYSPEKIAKIMRKQKESLKPREGSMLEYLINERLRVEEEVRKAAREEGWEEGLEEGIEKGIEKGMEKGMEKGLLIAIKAMHAKGFALVLDVEEAWVSRVLEKL